MNRIDEIDFGERKLCVEYVDSMVVKSGVDCDVYEFIDDETMDLALVHVKNGYRTPLQRVLKGVVTIEGYVSGEGFLAVGSVEGSVLYKFPNENNTPVEVKIGDTMQWFTSDTSDLVFYEICIPPYEEGRFENLAE